MRACRSIFPVTRRHFSSPVATETQRQRAFAMTMLNEWIEKGGVSANFPLKSPASCDHSGQHEPVTDPSTGQTIASYIPCSKDELDAVIDKAQAAQREWSRYPLMERSKVSFLLMEF